MEEQTLKEKTAKGLLWGGIHNGIMQLLNLVFGIFLARLLTPSDYGMIGMLLVFSSVAGILQESGFTTALINRKEFRHEDYNAVFWFSTLTGATLYIILFLCAPLIARFYHQPELTSLARYMFLSFVISSMGIAHNALLIKQMKIRQNAIIGITSLFISGIVGITMAYNGMAYWGIATQTLTYVFFIVVGRWHFSGWRPTFSFNFKPLREMIGFSMKILASNLITQINNNILTVILGRFYDSHQVGFYNQANKWKDMGSYTVQGMTNSVSQPVIRQVEEESERLIRIFRKMLRFAAFISMPCMFGLALTAPEIITIAITDKWLESARLMQILCIGAAFMPIQTLMYNMIISKEYQQGAFRHLSVEHHRLRHHPDSGGTVLLSLRHHHDGVGFHRHEHCVADRVVVLCVETDGTFGMAGAERRPALCRYRRRQHPGCRICRLVHAQHLVVAAGEDSRGGGSLCFGDVSLGSQHLP